MRQKETIICQAAEFGLDTVSERGTEDFQLKHSGEEENANNNRVRNFL